ncbi:RNA polymerase sigma factor [Corynebacterium marinum]|nr:sigma-70 family RNA polymerase sigma factor [Corynebacterium marinum]GGO22100.1 hypothetical protein GCM10010980_23810 [Corynebacterium marinum]
MEDADELFEPGLRRRRNAVQRWVTSQTVDEVSRRDGDRELYQILADQGFRGADYADFERELVDYGFMVIRSWLRKGKLLEKCGSLKVKGISTGIDLDPSSLREHEIEDLTEDIVADGIYRFREQSLFGGRWRPNGPASMRTFFINRCLFSSADPLTAFHRQRKREQEMIYLDGFSDRGSFVDPENTAEAVTQDIDLMRLVGMLGPQDREILTLHLEGLKHREIGQKMGTTPKGIERRLARIHARLRDDATKEETA